MGRKKISITRINDERNRQVGFLHLLLEPRSTLKDGFIAIKDVRYIIHVTYK